MADAVLSELIDNSEAVNGPLRRHGLAATRRRWSRALVAPVLAAVVLAATSFAVTVPGWVWPLWLVVAACCVGLAIDRSRSLGHRVADGWMVARTGSLERRRDCIALRRDHRVDGAPDPAAATGRRGHAGGGHGSGAQAVPRDRRAGRHRVVGRRRRVTVGGGQRVGRPCTRYGRVLKRTLALATGEC